MFLIAFYSGNTEFCISEESSSTQLGFTMSAGYVQAVQPHGNGLKKKKAESITDTQCLCSAIAVELFIWHPVVRVACTFCGTMWQTLNEHIHLLSTQFYRSFIIPFFFLVQLL